MMLPKFFQWLPRGLKWGPLRSGRNSPNPLSPGPFLLPYLTLQEYTTLPLKGTAWILFPSSEHLMSNSTWFISFIKLLFTLLWSLLGTAPCCFSGLQCLPSYVSSTVPGTQQCFSLNKYFIKQNLCSIFTVPTVSPQMFYTSIQNFTL